MEKKRDHVYGERDNTLIQLRYYFHRLFQVVQGVVKKIKRKKGNDSKSLVIVATGFYDIDSLKEFFTKCNWYLPSELVKLNIYVDAAFNTDSFDLDEYKKEFMFIEDSLFDYNSADFILLNNWKDIFRIKFLGNIDKISIIDKVYFSYTESLEWQNLLYKCLNDDSKIFLENISKQNFLNYQLQKSHKRKATCFVTGPSFSEYSNFQFKDDDLIVICNSIVKNHDFLKHTNGADLLTFADPVFHFSFNKYSKIFRENMLSMFNEYRFFIAIPMQVYPVIYSNYPELRGHLIGVDYKRRTKEYNIPSVDQIWVKDNANILTNLMIPMASSVAEQICIIGADGRKPDEKYFWAHNSSVQFDDYLMASVFEAHPSFFRDRDYKDYYNQHCQSCDELLSHCENFGKKFFVLTKSYIPAFSKRFFINQTVEL